MRGDLKAWGVWIRRWYRAHKDGEHEQVLVRLGIALFVLAYFTVYSQILGGGSSSTWYWLRIIVPFTAFAIAQLVWVGLSPAPSVPRRVLGMVADLGTISLSMYYYGAPVSWLYILYVWSTSGNGLRYGIRYLFASMALSVFGFGLVIALNEYWRHNLQAGIGLAIGLIILPLYIGSLRGKLIRARADAERARDEAETANRAKSQFLANMSHEIRTPMSGIIGMSELLAELGLNAEQKQYIDTIRLSATNLMEIINAILDLSKIESGKETLHEIDFDLHALVKHTTALLGHGAKKKGLLYHVAIDPSVPFLLHGDENRLRQVLINLVGNAIKFTERGHVEIRVACDSETDETATIRFAVTDTGIGIPKEAQARIFEKFEQGDRSITRNYGGTGLGTAIARRLIGMMGGTLSLSSEPEVGTTFLFTIPFHKLAITPRATDNLKGKVLVISADPSVRDQLKTWLKGWGLGVKLLARPPRNLTEAGAAGRYRSILVDEGVLADPREFSQRVLHHEPALTEGLIVLRRHSVPPTATLLGSGYVSVLGLPLEVSATFNAVHACVVEPGDDDRVVPLAPRIASRSHAAQPLRILVAEDTEVNRIYIKALLERIGHRVDIVPGGDEALDAFCRQTYDLAIVDLHMPGRSGLDVIRAYRALDVQHQEMPFVVLTADTTERTRAMCESEGVHEILTKPVEPRVLDEIIRRVTDGQKSEEVALVSPAVLAELAELAPEERFFERILNQFIDDTDLKFDRLEIAARNRDAQELADVLHALKGNALNVGAEGLGKSCARLERKLTAFLAEGTILPALSELRDVGEHTCAVLKAELVRRSGT